MTPNDTKPEKAEASAVHRALIQDYDDIACGYFHAIEAGAHQCVTGPLKAGRDKAYAALLAALQSSSSAEAGHPGSMRVAPSHGNAEGSGTTSGAPTPVPGPSDEPELRAALQREIDAQITICAERDQYREAMLVAVQYREAAEAERDALRDRVKVLEEALLMCASHCQGGHSEAGIKIAKAFDIAFPLTMPNLESAADRLGHDRQQLWPWLYRMRAERAALNHGKGEDARHDTAGQQIAKEAEGST